MGTILRIALRNLVQHRSKTVIIGVLISVAIALGFVGNSVLDTAKKSLRRTFTDNFTGDVLVLPKGIQGGVFGSSQDGGSRGPPILPMMKDYDKVHDVVESRSGMASVTSQISAYVIFNLGDAGINWGLAFGIEPDDYFKSFNNIELIQGRRLRSGEPGIMLHERIVKSLKEANDVALKVGDTLQLNNFGESGFKIREVPVVGIFRYKAGNERAFAFMQPNFVDVTTLRALKGKPILGPEDLKVSAATSAALGASADEMFAEDTVVAQDAPKAKPIDIAAPLGAKGARADTVSTSTGAWNYILLRLAPGVDEKAFIKKLNADFGSKGLDVKAQDWVATASPDSMVFFAMSLVFNVVIWLLAIVSMIIIMNTLIASVMERTPEIGTMRALGAQRGFIRSLFITETTIVTLIFGAVGIAAGFLLTLLLHATGIAAPNDFMKLIFGGNAMRPDLDAAQALAALRIMVFIGLVSWIFPVRMALKVSPIKAIMSE
jgi:putative ABC transport system permease protein